jgi:hypothetical protein
LTSGERYSHSAAVASMMIVVWHDDIGKTFVAFMQDVDALLLGRRTYVIHVKAFAPNPAESLWALPVSDKLVRVPCGEF